MAKLLPIDIRINYLMLNPSPARKKWLGATLSAILEKLLD